MELTDIPKPYKRFYDDKRQKRLVFVRITTWRGIAIGAKHYYAEVYEDSNPIVYNGKHYHFSDDKKVEGKKFGGVLDTSFSTFDSALDWTVDIIKCHFSKHKLIECNGGLITLKQLKQEL